MQIKIEGPAHGSLYGYNINIVKVMEGIFIFFLLQFVEDRVSLINEGTGLRLRELCLEPNIQHLIPRNGPKSYNVVVNS